MTSTDIHWPSTVDIRKALHSSWSVETSDEPNAWSPENPGRGQCGATVLVVQDWLGGKLQLSNVHVDGKQIGYHYSNLLDDGTHFDPSGDQFYDNEVVSKPATIERTALLPKYGADRYILLSRRMRDILCT